MVERNPSPPHEFEKDQNVFRQDMIGDTTISKKWVYGTLMNMCEEAKDHSEQDEVDELDISDQLQDESCQLWDLCTEKHLAVFLVEIDAINLLCDLLVTSKSPRLTEIAVGVLGNMACTHEACDSITSNKEIQKVVLSLLSCRDSPTLVEVGRLITTCLADDQCKTVWLDFMESIMPQYMSDICFILNSSSNCEVLKSIIEIVDICLDSRDNLLSECLNIDLANALAEAGLQLHNDGDSLHGVESCLHALYVLTTEDKSMEIFKNNMKIFQLSLTCCEKWSNLENFYVEKDPTAVFVASTLAIINFSLNVNIKLATNFVDELSSKEKSCIYNVTCMVKNQFIGHLPVKNTADEKQKNASDGKICVYSDEPVNKNKEDKVEEVPVLEIAIDLLNLLERLKWKQFL